MTAREGALEGSVYLAYVDESGDSGYTNSPTTAFTLAAVVVHETQWLKTLEKLIDFRRRLKTMIGLPMKEEVKANQLIHNKGPWKSLMFNGQHFGPAPRMNVYATMMQLQASLAKDTDLRVFAVVVAKDRVRQKSAIDPRETAWAYLIQRLERFATNSNAERIMLFPDDGHDAFIRKMVRKMRRVNYVPRGSGFTNLAANNILEDPNPRRSHDSYFVQLADIDAYAAYRQVFPVATFPNMWDQLGAARHLPVNQVTGGLPGIVVWPR